MKNRHKPPKKRSGNSSTLSKDLPVSRTQLLEETLQGFMKGEVGFVPSCSPATYTVNVSYRVLVADCETDNVDESKEMGRGLYGRGLSSATAICELNRNCPNARLIAVAITRNVCRNRIWDVDATWTFECIP